MSLRIWVDMSAPAHVLVLRPIIAVVRAPRRYALRSREAPPWRPIGVCSIPCRSRSAWVWA